MACVHWSERVPQHERGHAAGLLVATHFVYSMALKRKRTFRAFAWDSAADGMEEHRNRTTFPDGECWHRSRKAILFSHTFFAQTTEAKAVLCAMPAGDQPECSCCANLRTLEAAGQPPANARLGMEATSGSSMRWNSFRALKMQQGCADYQLFWD